MVPVTALREGHCMGWVNHSEVALSTLQVKWNFPGDLAAH